MNLKKSSLFLTSAVLSFLLVVNIYNLISTKLQNAQLDRESKSITDQFVTKLANSWEPNDARPFFTQSIQDSLGSKSFEMLFEYLKKTLGPIKEYSGSKGETNFHLSPWGPKWISAEYQCEANFLYGSGVISVNLKLEKGGWKVQGFNASLKTRSP